MNILVRRAVLSDLENMLAVEKAAINIAYLSEVHKDFFADNTGEMSVALDDGRIVGFGKLTFQYDGSAWAELLRVHPDYQGKGVGNAIWLRYMQQCKAQKAPFIRMYTGTENVVSKHLAEKYGLDRAVEFSECSYAIGEREKKSTDFYKLDATSITAGLNIIKQAWGEYSCFNRTFYHIGVPFLSALAKEGKLYSDGNSVIALGARFMPQRGINAGFICGDVEKCIAFAKYEGMLRGAPKVTVMHSADDKALANTFTALNFEYLDENLYMLEGKL